MKDLSKLAEELNKKQTWVRKGLENLLEEWAEATASINDLKLMNVILWWQDEYPYEVYFITAGHPEVNFLRADAFNSLSEKELYDQSGWIKFNECDFNIIREVVKELPKSLDEFAKRVKNAGEEIDQWKDFLEKFQDKEGK